MRNWLSRWWDWKRVLEETAEITVEEFRGIRSTVIETQPGRDSRLYAAYCRWYEIDQNDWHHW